MEITKIDFLKAINKYDSLTDKGINSQCFLSELSENEIRRELELQRERFFLNYFHQFKISCEWMVKFKKIKTPQFSSYYLKHAVEKLSGRYISNGALIAAAIHLNIPMKFKDNWPNVNVAISKRCPYIKTLDI